MKIYSLFFLSFFFMANISAQDKVAYKLFNAEGKKLKYKKLLKEAAQADIVFFGELHNNPIAHWWEWELLNDLIQLKGKKLIAGGEMWETDMQDAVDSLMRGEIKEKDMKRFPEWWNNYKTDYKPFSDLCKENGIPLIATNIPRRYARIVVRKGLEGLDELPAAEKALIMPLPVVIDYEIPSYKGMIEMFKSHIGDLDPKRFVAAQATKDATMADRILRVWKKGKLFLHINGSYHSDSKEGIIWHLLRQNPDLKIFNLSCVEQADVIELETEHKGKADAIIVIPESMTKTY